MRSLADRRRQEQLADQDDRVLESRSDRKKVRVAREQHLKQLAEQLVSLSGKQLARLPLTEELRASVEVAKTIKSANARNRQVGMIRQHLREGDHAALGERVERLLTHRSGPAVDTLRERVLSWRRELLEHRDEALARLLSEFPHADRQRLRQSLRAALRSDPVELANEPAGRALDSLDGALRAALGAVPDDSSGSAS